MPRWSDDPSHLLGVIKNYLRLTDEDRSPSDQFAEGNEQAESMVVELVGRMRRRSRVRARVVGFGLRRARQLAGLRERPKFMLVLALAAMRQQLGLVGETLADRGRIARSDDIFFLDLAEARRGLAGRGPVRRWSSNAGRPTSSSCVVGTCHACCSPTARSRRRSGPPRSPTVRWWAARRRPAW